MFDWFLLFARELLLAVWLGGLIVIDFVEAPAKFRVAEINRNQAVAVGRKVFAALNRLEVALGALLLLVGALLLRRAAAGFALFERLAIAALGVMWLVALAQYLWLRPRMSALSEGLDLVNRQAGDPRYKALARLHRVYVACDLFKIALGVAALAARAARG